MSEWVRPDRKAEADQFLDTLYRLQHVVRKASQQSSDSKIVVTVAQQVFIDVVFLLLSELDYHRAADMGLPQAYQQWQFSFNGITVRANRNASGWAYPDRIQLPDGSIIDPKGGRKDPAPS